MDSLMGQVAIVTGAGRGLGREFARALSAAGAAVGLIARSQSELAESAASIQAAGGRTHAVSTDVSDRDAVHAAFEAIEQSLGPADVLVNNAGIAGPIRPFCETDSDDWWRVLEVNLRGPIICTRAVLSGMISRRRGRIINIAASAIPIANFSAYSTSKTALIRFSECVAAETKPHGIAAFAVAPGTVRTAMSEHALNSTEGQKWLPWFRRIFDEGVDLPADVPAQLVVRLASGKFDALSGLFLTPLDDLDAIVAGMEEVGREKLYSMRVRALASAAGNRALASIRSAAERG
jgi:NAD(P)-dependent dehydrogenase (short-subunit alcohol dehydrogenase family)